MKSKEITMEAKAKATLVDKAGYYPLFDATSVINSSEETHTKVRHLLGEFDDLPIANPTPHMRAGLASIVH